MSAVAAPTRVAVLGLGLIGGSLALALAPRDEGRAGSASPGGAPHLVRGYDRDPEVRAAARRRGVDVAGTLAEAVREAALVVAAVPTDATPDLLREALAANADAVLTDVASLKGPIVAFARELPASARLVGGHPMAGSTAEGIAAADPALFRGRPWLVVPTARSDVASVASVGALARAAGARPLVVSAERHDALMTWVTQLPLLLAGALARAAHRAGGDAVARVAGPGFLDATRLAGTGAPLALELTLADPPALATALERMVAALDELAIMLERGDETALRRLLDEARAARVQLDALMAESSAK